MTRKILCVDDDVNILQGYKRTLRKDLDISIAEGGEQGLSLITQEGPFAVIVSDMRMPGMDGVQFLARVKEVSPASVRIMLTGNSDQQTAMDAVNEGSIFRFLTKPCPLETLAKALHAGLEQYRLVTAEKQLLEETLNNSLQVMVDILALVNATAFSRATRVKRLARDIAEQLGMSNTWEVEIAALLSQIGCITVPEETLHKVANGDPLTGKELTLYQHHPQIGHDLIARIPRLERVAEIIAQQNKRLDDAPASAPLPGAMEGAVLGARILKAVLDLDNLLNSGHLPHNAIREMAGRSGWYDPVVFKVLKDLIYKTAEEYVTVKVAIPELKPGMILDKALMTNRAALLLSAGQEITLSLILRLANFADAGIIPNEIQVRIPVSTLPTNERATMA